VGINRSPDGFGNPHMSGASFLFVDGSVRYLTNDMSPEILQALSNLDKED
jgi:prepilin-type processing-associated H-X9-DG protein